MRKEVLEEGMKTEEGRLKIKKIRKYSLTYKTIKAVLKGGLVIFSGMTLAGTLMAIRPEFFSNEIDANITRGFVMLVVGALGSVLTAGGHETFFDENEYKDEIKALEEDILYSKILNNK